MASLDAVQRLQRVAHVGGVLVLAKLLVDGLDVGVALGVQVVGRLGDQRLEALEDRPGQDLEALPRVVGTRQRGTWPGLVSEPASAGRGVGSGAGAARRVDGFHRVGQRRDAHKASGARQAIRLKSQAAQERLKCRDRHVQRDHPVLQRRHDLGRACSVVAQCIHRQRGRQAAQHA